VICTAWFHSTVTPLMRSRFQCPSKRCVFKFRLKRSDSTIRSHNESGSEFQTVRPATGQCLSYVKSLSIPDGHFAGAETDHIRMHRVVLRIPQSHDIFERNGQHGTVLGERDITGRLLPIKSNRTATPAWLLLYSNITKFQATRGNGYTST